MLKIIIGFNKGLMGMPFPWPVWLMVLVGGNMIAPLFLLDHMEAQVTFGVFLAGADDGHLRRYRLYQIAGRGPCSMAGISAVAVVPVGSGMVTGATVELVFLLDYCCHGQQQFIPGYRHRGRHSLCPGGAGGDGRPKIMSVRIVQSES